MLVVVPRMHEDEVDIDDALVRRLLRSQLPHLADRPLSRVEAWGTDHAIFRLGDDLSVRLPKIGWASDQGDKESRWLPALAPHLPAEVPVPQAVGRPAHGYPFRWYVSPWLDGDNPEPDGTVDLCRLAVDLAAFVLALQHIDPSGAPTPQPAKRGGPLPPADRFTRESAERLRGESPVRSDAGARSDVEARSETEVGSEAGVEVDVDGLVAVWDAGLHAPPWDGPPVWVHGDLMDGNLLVRNGRLNGVIDWGGLVAGDPAVELMVAWSFFDADSRSAYRHQLGFVDDAMWLRGRAWAASAAIQALPYYRHTNPDIVARSLRAVRAVLDDLGTDHR